MGAILVIAAGWGMVLAARGLGEWALKPLRVADAPRLTRALWAVGLGLGAIALGTLGLGLAGVPRAALGICALGIALGLRPLVTDMALAGMALRGFRWASWNGILLGACLVVFAANCFFCLLPQFDYDVLEYHLGAPMHYLRLGAVEHLPWNVYASFPENTEMLYLCLLALFGGAMKGGMAAAALNVAVGALCALAVADLARAVFDARASIPAAALFYAYPLTWSLSIKGYVELEQVLFSVLCVRALVGEGGRRAALAGVLAGLAMGTKYPAAAFLTLPVGLYLLGRQGFLAAGAFALAAVATVSPWLGKNVVATRNPVYPLLGDVFETRGWSEEQEARFAQAHHPPRPSLRQAYAELWTAVTGQQPSKEGEIAWDPPRVALVLLLGPLLLLLPMDRLARRSAAPLLGLTLAHVAVWWYLTHRIDRFFYPAVPWLAVVGGAAVAAVSNEFLRNLARCATAILIWFHAAWGAPNLALNAGVVETVVRPFDPWEVLASDDAPGFQAMRYVNEELPRDARVLLLGEAQTFYLERDFVAATVFDDNPWEDLFPIPPADGAQVREVLRARGITHVLVNWFEVDRLRRTFAFRYGGQERPGYSPTVAPEVFHVLERDALEKVKGFGPVIPALEGEGVVLYRVRPG